MPKQALKSDDEAGFLRAFRDEVLDLALEHKMRLEFHLCVPVTKKGLMIRGTAWRKDASGAENWFAGCEVPYPTHQATRFHAALYWAACKLGIAIRLRKSEMAETGSPSPLA